MGSEEVWSGIRVWYPPRDPKGAYYLTKFLNKREEKGKVIVEMELVLDESQEPLSE